MSSDNNQIKRDRPVNDNEDDDDTGNQTCKRRRIHNPSATPGQDPTPPTNFLHLKAIQEGFFEQVIDTLYPTNWKRSLKEIKKLINTHRLFYLHGRVTGATKRGRAVFTETDLSRYLEQKMDNLGSNPSLRCDLSLILSKNMTKVTTGNLFGVGEPYQSGIESGSEAEPDELVEYKTTVPRLLLVLVRCLADGADDEHQRVANFGAARVLVVYMLNLFFADTLHVNREKALRLFSHSPCTLSPDHYSEVYGHIVSTLFDGDSKSIKNLTEQASKTYDFMTNQMPHQKDTNINIFLLKAFDPSVDDEAKTQPIQEQLRSLYLDRDLDREQQAAVVVERTGATTTNTIHPAPGTPPEPLYTALQDLFQAATKVATIANNMFPNGGYDRFINPSLLASPPTPVPPSTPVPAAGELIEDPIEDPISNLLSPAAVFTDENICRNKIMLAALRLSPKQARTSTTLNELLSSDYEGRATTLTERAGAGLVLSTDDFTIVGKLGHGSYASVYKGYCKGTIVAVKMLSVRAQDVYREVRRGLNCSALLGDKFVVRTLGYCILNQEDWNQKSDALQRSDTLSFAIVNELGTTTLDAFKRTKENNECGCGTGADAMVQKLFNRRIARQRCKDFLPILHNLLQGLVEMHKIGIYHRDVKPANVICVDGLFKLGDWDTAIKPDERDHKATIGIGTALYQPPEAEDGQYIKADVFAFGVLAYEMLVGSIVPKLPVNNTWFDDKKDDSRRIFRYAEGGNDIGQALKELVQNMTTQSFEDRWDTPTALGELNKIVDIFNESQK